ncbi:hypothetical protein B0H14DRAFT_2606849 [Mycena olivaceomarginata]|nr:hypothetical protein B0H14DRAFT_2606849 [Mycena olivaceomarginata]
MYFLCTGALLDNVLWDRPQTTWDNPNSKWEFPCVDGPSHHSMGIPNANNRSWDIPHHYGNDHMYHIRKACILSVGIPTCNVGIPSQKWEHPRHTWERDWECPHFIYMWAFPVVTWAFPVATGNAHITHIQLGMPMSQTGMRLGMPTHTIYVGDGNDHNFHYGKAMIWLEFPHVEGRTTAGVGTVWDAQGVTSQGPKKLQYCVHFCIYWAANG